MTLSLLPEDREFLIYVYSAWADHRKPVSAPEVACLDDGDLINQVSQDIPKAIHLWQDGGFRVLCQMIEKSGDPFMEIDVPSLL